MTLREAHIAAARTLSVDPQLRVHAGRDAERLILHALSLSPNHLRAYPEMPLSPDQQHRIQSLIARRLAHEPLQYILGKQEFFSLNLRVTPATLIPRPETELLVEAVLDRRPARIVDVGTGSGAIAIALAHHLPQAHILALDLSPEALIIARENAEAHHVAERIQFFASDLLAALPRDFHPDAIVSNPPYIPETDRPTLHPQVRDHEPELALFAGPDGLALYRRLIPQARQALAPQGLLAVEFGFGQADALTQLLTEWNVIEVCNDLQNIPRVVLATKPA